jgi:hypothetical protein
MLAGGAGYLTKISDYTGLSARLPVKWKCKLINFVIILLLFPLQYNRNFLWNPLIFPL